MKNEESDKILTVTVWRFRYTYIYQNKSVELNWSY